MQRYIRITQILGLTVQIIDNFQSNSESTVLENECLSFKNPLTAKIVQSARCRPATGE
jgi:hypothetical protein